jgi:SPP1 family predicted phage head-tail adaptor
VAVKMTAPRLRHRVDLQTFEAVQDSNTGAVTEQWVYCETNIPAEIWPMSGREFVAAQAVQAGVTTKITIRHHMPVHPRMRVIHGCDIYNIKAVLPDPSLRRHLTLMCEVGVNEG